MAIKRFIKRRVETPARVLVALSALAVGGTVIGVASGSAAAKPKTVTLQFWSTYNTADKEASTIAKVIIPKFEKENPGIKVDSVIYPYADLLNKFIATSAAGSPPDVMRSDIGWVAQLAQQHLIVNVSKLKSFTSIKSNILPGPLSTTKVNGKYWAFPDDTNTQALYWNKADFAAAGISGPPTTITQMIADAQQLTVPSKQQYGLGVDGTDIWNMAPYIWSMGGSFTNSSYTTASGYMDSCSNPDRSDDSAQSPEGGRHRQRLQGWCERRLGRSRLPEGRVRDVH